MSRDRALRGQMSIPDDTDVEMELIPGCTATTIAVLITPTTNGALLAVPPVVTAHEVAVEDEHVRITLWMRRRI